ncbi:hypothetical protein HETIRDRAFT_440362 [Heterobasidion irregulare TC 32-1]|uniref:Peptidase A1 domain-containing protein n=1 Tax=Heterobasidion irregulare (strain TC 32-1) TaxID=747525 RepID=W4K554_HETIT|nr:uncharacterized protein HETIRDRAFT_440362 [Heterobasidion irregulare TC 32-1]ETW80500.1 hypothetical protein HETIRDRAFT_440362 [Heterobasidion irregulare TC 32-1]
MGTGVEPLQDFAPGNVDLLYYGPVDIGTPAQRLTIDIDTGSADLWVPVNCTSCNGRSFDPAQSSTYTNTNQPFSITYGSGAVSGTLATDVVSIAGFTVQQQAFGAIDGESADFQGQPNDGLLGMAFGTIAQSRRPTFFENLIEGRQLAAPLFSVHLERRQETGSEVCFGCVDADRIDGTGSITWIPVKSQTYWAIGMDGIAANGQVAQTNILAAIDTGTTLVYLPNELAARFYALVPGSKLAAQFGPGFYTYPCASRPTVELSFDGTRFALDLRDFNLGRTALGSADCVGGILAAGDGFPSNLAIVGDEFLKSCESLICPVVLRAILMCSSVAGWDARGVHLGYSIYDYSNGARVGFAQDANNKP